MNRNTMIAGGIFVALGVAAFAVLRSPEKGTRIGELPRPVPKLTDVDTLEVTKGGATTVVKKDGTTFKVVSPVKYLADQEGAKQAFEQMEKLEFDGIVSDQKAKHAEFEVDDKAPRVVAKKGDKVLADLRVGKVGNGVTMVRLEGKDEVWKATGYQKFVFDKDTSLWRDKSISTFAEGDAQKIEIVSKGAGKIVLHKPAKPDAGQGQGQGDDDWRVVESSLKLDPMDKMVAGGIVSTLAAWKANDFADDAKPADSGLDDPQNRITVSLTNNRTVQVLIGKRKNDEDYFVKLADNPQVFLVKKFNLERVNKRPMDFREKTICNLTEGEITEVSVARDKDAYTLVKQAGKTGDDAWKVTKPAGVALDTTKVNAIVGAFHDWKGTGFAEDPKATGMGKPSATIVARSNVKGAGCVLKVGGETSDKQNKYVERAGMSDAFVVPNWSLDRVLVKVDDLKKKS